MKKSIRNIINEYNGLGELIDNEELLIATLEHFHKVSFYELENIIEYVSNDLGYCRFNGIVNDPKGTKQKSSIPNYEYEWVEQTCGIAGDDYSGTIALPFYDKYIELYFQC